MTKFIDDLSVKSDKIIEMENKADLLYENVISDFKKDLPNLKDVDYRLFLFNVHGIANPTISLLLKETRINAVYERKRRIKDKIKQLEESKRAKYLRFL